MIRFTRLLLVVRLLIALVCIVGLTCPAASAAAEPIPPNKPGASLAPDASGGLAAPAPAGECPPGSPCDPAVIAAQQQEQAAAALAEPAKTPAVEQQPLPQPAHLPRGAYQVEGGRWVAASDAPTAGAAGLEAPANTGGPDDFGYTWDDSGAFQWLDMAAATDTGLSQSNYSIYVSSPIDLGFPFKFYENAYTSAQISTSGAIGFDGSNLGYSSYLSYLPEPRSPNNAIMAFLTTLRVNAPGYDGRVLYQRGGTPGLRYFGVEWRDASDAYGGKFTFQAVLHENGDIELSYLSMAQGNSYSCGTAAGIEDATGADGLAYRQAGCNRMNEVTGRTVRIRRPNAAARVQLSPYAAGRLVHPGQEVRVPITVRNKGEFGTDVFDFTATSTWPLSLVRQDGTDLSDTDGDAMIDTGPLPQSGELTVYLKLRVPPAAVAGQYGEVNLVARSSLDPSRTRTAAARLAIPAPFVQTQFNSGPYVLADYFVQPGGDIMAPLPTDGNWPYELGVAELPNGNFVNVWSRYRSINNNLSAYEIYYAILGPTGAVIVPPRRLTDHSSATVSTYDYPAVAVAPNGRIGITWYRYRWDNGTSRFNYNMYLSVLDSSGNLISGPTSLTNNDQWALSEDDDAPRFFRQRIAETADNRFVVGWQREHQHSGSWYDRVWYAIADSNGGIVSGPTQLTSDSYAELHSVNRGFGNSAFFTIQKNWDLFYAAVDSSGAVLKSTSPLPTNGAARWSSDAVLLSGGRLFVAWSNYTGQYANRNQLAYALLDGGYNLVVPPTVLNNPVSQVGNGDISVAASGSNAVLSWSDDANYQPNMYYALVADTGGIVTPPTISVQTSSGNLAASSSGNGVASYHWSPSQGVDLFLSTPTTQNGTIGATASLPISLGNHGATVATGVQLFATLPAGVTYLSDTSGVQPYVNGSDLRWDLPDMALWQALDFTLRLRLAAGITPGAHLPVALSLRSATADANPADNGVLPDIVAQTGLSGGPDGYGYRYYEVGFDWIDATQGTHESLTGDDQASSSVEIGFPFPFYENAYSQLYFNTNGLVTFGGSTSSYSSTRLPLPASPNNLIAAYWRDLAVGQSYNPGGIYTLRGGTAPNRYFVVQWDKVTNCCNSGGTDYKTFEAVLYENGDIVLQYQKLMGTAGYNATAGLEDRHGAEGLTVFSYTAPADGQAIRFTRPAPAARVKIVPAYQGKFSAPGQEVAFMMPVINSGNVGADVFDVSGVISWPARLYGPDGVTELIDTDHDGAQDTGALAPGAESAVIVKMRAPLGATAGTWTEAQITVRSSLNPSQARTARLQSAIPAPFAQIYSDAWYAMRLSLNQPQGQADRMMTYNYTSNPIASVTELANGSFFYLWSRYTWTGAVGVNNLEYTIVDRYGTVLVPVTLLTDNTAAAYDTSDYAAVAAAPDGTVGILWYRYQYDRQTSKSNYNIHFGALDDTGRWKQAPVNLTQNAVWAYSGDLNVPSFYYPHIAATADNRFVLVWNREHRESAGYVGDVYLSVRDTAGNEVKGITKLTNDTAGSDDGYYRPNVTGLTGSRALVTWYRSGNYGDIYYQVLNSAGGTMREATNLSNDAQSSWDYNPDAAQLGDGKTVVAWTGAGGIRFALIDALYNPTGGVYRIDAPAAYLGSDYVSVAPTTGNRAVLTWLDSSSSYRANLYYALVDSTAALVTPATIFASAPLDAPRLYASNEGYGNTSYSWTPAAGADISLQAGPRRVATPVGWVVEARVTVQNRGGLSATDGSLQMALPTGMSYVGDSSGISPQIDGPQITWHFPTLGFLERRDFSLYLRSGSAAIGAPRPVTLVVSQSEPDADAGNNWAQITVVAGKPTFAPMIRR